MCTSFRRQISFNTETMTNGMALLPLLYHMYERQVDRHNTTERCVFRRWPICSYHNNVQNESISNLLIKPSCRASAMHWPWPHSAQVCPIPWPAPARPRPFNAPRNRRGHWHASVPPILDPAPRTPVSFFNLRHAVLRRCVERAYGVLKSRFPILSRRRQPSTFAGPAKKNVTTTIYLLHRPDTTRLFEPATTGLVSAVSSCAPPANVVGGSLDAEKEGDLAGIAVQPVEYATASPQAQQRHAVKVTSKRCGRASLLSFFSDTAGIRM
ncbi:hypothetical protein BCR44DRAFT_1215971 [Catenaria anguillulae PL171]|uniref:DDE Tnp4 domain-containing protein n=1 Tax=Catenaria anguillulae PL171 TaxID=765915 RepID=A0A1Y2HYW8_9FUNG|nr:hypothetical protein BCR44DRAFT_1215971 [Catenaria anguillulae PL171]